MTQDVSHDHTHHTALDALFRYAEFLKFGELHVKFDRSNHFRAIIAINNLKLGPGLGGCRIVQYPNTDSAIEDVLRLAYMMSLKSAINNIAHGGAKAVLITPKIIPDRKALLHSFADFVNQLNGRYITAVDSGTNINDMDIIAERTPFVTCTSKYGEQGNPSLYTALGVRRSIEAAVKFRLGKDSLDGVHVAIQGAGQVGYFLAKELTQLGARLTMTDVNPAMLQRCVDDFKVATCLPEFIYSVPADVFSPCALGSTLNVHTIHQLRVSIVAGSANNQLAHHHHGDLLQQCDILYAPDFVANAGGLIYAAAMYDHDDFNKASKQVNDIYHTMMDIFTRANNKNISTAAIAEQIALEKLK